MKRLALLTLSLCGLVGLSAQKYSNEFLAIGAGARAHGMGTAVVASDTDPTAIYWNPAGLAWRESAEGLQLSAMHAEWFAGVGKYDFLAMSIPTNHPQRRLGVSLLRFGIDDIANTLFLYDEDGSVNYDNVVSFSAADYALLLSYAWHPRNKAHHTFGLSTKVIRRVIGTFANAWGFGFDLGWQYRQGDWRGGVTLRDATTTFNAWRNTLSEAEKDQLLATGNELPQLSALELTRPSLLVGAARLLRSGKWLFQPELNLRITTDGRRNTLLATELFSADLAAGIELTYDDFLFLRAGTSQFQQERTLGGRTFWSTRPAAGIGMKLGRLRLDYAFSDIGDGQGRFSHIVSLQLQLPPKSPR